MNHYQAAASSNFLGILNDFDGNGHALQMPDPFALNSNFLGVLGADYSKYFYSMPPIEIARDSNFLGDINDLDEGQIVNLPRLGFLEDEDSSRTEGQPTPTEPASAYPPPSPYYPGMSQWLWTQFQSPVPSPYLGPFHHSNLWTNSQLLFPSRPQVPQQPLPYQHQSLQQPHPPLSQPNGQYKQEPVSPASSSISTVTEPMTPSPSTTSRASSPSADTKTGILSSHDVSEATTHGSGNQHMSHQSILDNGSQPSTSGLSSRSSKPPSSSPTPPSSPTQPCLTSPNSTPINLTMSNPNVQNSTTPHPAGLATSRNPSSAPTYSASQSTSRLYPTPLPNSQPAPMENKFEFPPDVKPDLPPVEESRLNTRRCCCPNCTNSSKGDKGKPRKHLCHIEGCEKVYTKTSHLKAHLRVHNNFRPFKCAEARCGKSFTRSDELFRHAKTHSADREFQCNHCERGFTRSDHLAKHAKIHSRLVPVKRGRKKGSGGLAAYKAAMNREEIFPGVPVPPADDQVAETITTEFTIEPYEDDPNQFYVVPETYTTTVTPGTSVLP